ncbi:MAG: GntR family transcriptional regulator [Deltaproteobacteria bacterium]|nr:GntR family transcriptional regulator [Deltaproteobacteria bacterium]
MPSLKERVIRELRHAITQGEYPPGAHLTEAALCERFQVSRTPVREALNQLEMEGFLKIIPAAGARVVELSLQQAVDIYDVLVVLEGAACRLACDHITDDEIRKLDEYNFVFEKASETTNSELLFQANYQFHWLITEATQNSYLIDVRANFRRLVDQLGRLFPQEIPDQLVISVLEHRQIIDALKVRNAALSEFLMREHLEGAKKRLFAYFRRKQENSPDTSPSAKNDKKRDLSQIKLASLGLPSLAPNSTPGRH